jgi:hypothetical protein
MTLLILWYVDLLLGNDRETNDTMAVVRQQPARKNGSTVGSGVFCVVRSEAIWLDRPSSVQLVSAVQLSTVEWSELIGEQLEDCCSSVVVSCCCEKLVTEARGYFGNPEEGERRPLKAATKQRLVKTVTYWEDLMCPVVISEVCRTVRA